MKQILTIGLLLMIAAAPTKPKDPGVVSLDVCVDRNRIFLLTATRTNDRPAVMVLQRSDDGGATWTMPVPIGADQPAPEPIHRGMDAQIAASGDHVIAIWTTGADTKMGRGPLATAISNDGGKTWTAGASPSDDGQISDHAFVDIAADDAGTFHAVWLDPRDGGGKGLRYARSSDGGKTWSKNQTLDAKTCECCWNKITTGPGGRVNVLYRNESPRDMSLVTSTDGGQSWAAPVTVGAFDWKVDGCPHVGGALAGDGDKLFAAVWTAKGDGARGAYVLASVDAGRLWSQPIQLGDSTSWHPDLAYAGDRLIAVWDAYGDGGTIAYSATSRDDGLTWSPPERLNAAGTSASQPRVIRIGNSFRIFWTERRSDTPYIWTSMRVE